METKRLHRIQALLNKAEGGTTAEEAKLLVAKAHELMVKWGIEEAHLAAARNSSGPRPEVGVTRIFIEYSPYQTPKVALMNAIAKAQGCRLVMTTTYSGPGGKRGNWVDVVGLPQQREFVEMLYASLLVQAANEFAHDEVQERMFAETSHPGHRIKWRNGFMTGYATAISKRLRDRGESAVADAGSGAELVLRDRDSMVKSWMDDQYGSLRSRKMSAGGRAGRESGFAAGKRADLGDPKVPGSRRAVGRG